MAFTKVGDLLTTKRNLFAPQNKTVSAVTIVAAWNQVVKDVNCVEKFTRVQPIAYKNGVLSVRAASSALASELKMCEEKILKAYDKRFGRPVVERLVIKRM